MVRMIYVTVVLLLCRGTWAQVSGNSEPRTPNPVTLFEYFVTRDGDKLMEGQKEYRFISFNIPNLHYVEDNLPFEQTNPWRLPDEFEITDALTSIKQMGGQAVRLYALSMKKAGDDPNIPRHVLGPGQFNEQAFRALDKVLEVANKTGVRVIIPFVDNWVWWGGIAEYAAFRGKTKEAFWTDPQVIDDFKQTIEYVINRTNTCTGVKYKDDKAILAWETGNELQCPAQWTHQIAAYIKSLDKNHLLVDGFHTSILRNESIDEPLTDIVTTHHYPKNPQEMLEQVRANCARVKGKKPYFVGEFGFVQTEAVRELLDTVISEGVSGALIWSLRFHNRDGGFYWHSEPFGGDKYKAYHWPGFASGHEYDERNLLKLMRQKAYEIQRLPIPQLDIPQPPRLLPIDDVSAISWQGSAGASSYIVERSVSNLGPWSVIGQDITDAAVPYRPLFNDMNVEIGKQYFYRIKAKNTRVFLSPAAPSSDGSRWGLEDRSGGGISEPSNVVGPVLVKHLTLVDEMMDFSLMYERAGSMSLENKQARKTKEDMHRLVLSNESYIVYKVPLEINKVKVYSFISGQAKDIKLAISHDGERFDEIPVQKKIYVSGAGESDAYGYLRPVAFYAENTYSNSKYLKIKSTKDVQIPRVEIDYGGSPIMSEEKRLESFLKSAQDELEKNILSFWINYSKDNEYGGFIGRMSNDGTIAKDAPKGLVLNARILWTFSAAYRYKKNDEYLQMAKRSFDYIMQHFWDKDFGGAYWLLSAKGQPIDDSKELYGQSFLIYGLSEYYLATGDNTALEKAKELFYLIEKHCHDDANKGYFETFSRDWSAADRARLATGDAREKKTMNTHLHLLEAYTNLYRAWKDHSSRRRLAEPEQEKLKTRLEELVEIFQEHIIDPETFHFKLFFDEQWHSTKDIISFGHDIEGSWLLCEAVEVLDKPEQVSQVKEIALKMAEAVYEQGLDGDGGLFYEARGTDIINKNKEWWPQAETVVGFLNAYELSGRKHFLRAALDCWKFIEQYIVNKTHGEWFWRVSHDGTPDLQEPKVSEWKSPYHNSRVCLETIRRLKDISKGG